MDDTTNYILIIVKNMDGKKVHFKMRRNTPMTNLMHAYCDHSSLDFDKIVFLFKDQRIWPDQSPFELNIEDGDEIEACFYEHWRIKDTVPVTKPFLERTNHMRLIVKNTDGEKAYFKIRRNTQMKKLMNAYCNHSSLDYDSTAFLHNGRRIWPDQCPYQLDMEDGDEIDAVFSEHWRACIIIRVRGQVGFEASYKVRRNAPLKILMDDYCEQFELDFDGVGFLFKGSLAQPEQTPHELGIEDGDEMLVMLHLRTGRD